MAVNTIDFTRNLSGVNTDRGPTPVIWADCPIIDFQENPANGMLFFDDFLVTGSGPSAAGGAIAQSLGQWSAYTYQGGTVVDGALEGGVIKMGSDGDNEGVAISSGAGSFRLVTTSTNALNGKLWFEARVATDSIATGKGDLFVGLADAFLSSGLPQAAWPIQTTNDTLFAAMNAIGFQRKGSVGTDWSAVYQLASTTSVYPTNLTTLTATVTPAQTLAANTFVKLGFIFDPFAATRRISSASTGQTVGNLRRPIVRFFVNGLELPAFLTTDNTAGAAFPTGFMAPTIAIMNQTGSTPPTLSADWIRVSQVANS